MYEILEVVRKGNEFQESIKLLAERLGREDLFRYYDEVGELIERLMEEVKHA